MVKNILAPKWRRHKPVFKKNYINVLLLCIWLFLRWLLLQTSFSLPRFSKLVFRHLLTKTSLQTSTTSRWPNTQPHFSIRWALWVRWKQNCNLPSVCSCPEHSESQINETHSQRAPVNHLLLLSPFFNCCLLLPLPMIPLSICTVKIDHYLEVCRKLVVKSLKCPVMSVQFFFFLYTRLRQCKLDTTPLVFLSLLVVRSWRLDAVCDWILHSTPCSSSCFTWPFNMAACSFVPLSSFPAFKNNSQCLSQLAAIFELFWEFYTLLFKIIACKRWKYAGLSCPSLSFLINFHQHAHYNYFVSSCLLRYFRHSSCENGRCMDMKKNTHEKNHSLRLDSRLRSGPHKEMY